MQKTAAHRCVWTVHRFRDECGQPVVEVMCIGPGGCGAADYGDGAEEIAALYERLGQAGDTVELHACRCASCRTRRGTARG